MLLARQLRDMDAANKAPRCQHIKANGVRCASPAMRELEFCFFHEKFYNPPYDDSFPPLEDANAVQCAILQVLNGLKSKAITVSEARAMLYGLKAASINSRRTTFEPIMQAQVTELPSAVQRKTAQHSEPREADRDAALKEFLHAVQEQSSTTAKKPASSTPSTEVIPSNGIRTSHSEGHGFSRDARESNEIRTASSASPSASASKSRAGQGFSPDKNGGAKRPSASSASSSTLPSTDNWQPATGNRTW